MSTVARSLRLRWHASATRALRTWLVRVSGAVVALGCAGETVAGTPRAPLPTQLPPDAQRPASSAARGNAACESLPTAELLAETTTAPPARIALQLGGTGGFIIVPPFERVPALTLLTDGQLIYTHPSPDQREDVLSARLDPKEAASIVGHVLELGFERLVSHTSECSCTDARGLQICTSDGDTTILRVRAPSGLLRELFVYGSYFNEPDTMRAILAYLDTVRRRAGTPFVPEKATLYVLPLQSPPARGCRALDLPWFKLSTAQTPLDVTSAQIGDLVTRLGPELRSVELCDPTKKTAYSLQVFPWLPGAERPATPVSLRR